MGINTEFKYPRHALKKSRSRKNATTYKEISNNDKLEKNDGQQPVQRQ
jgi:hypothetical protein